MGESCNVANAEPDCLGSSLASQWPLTAHLCLTSHRAWILGGSLHYRGKSAMINAQEHWGPEDILQNSTSLLQLLNKIKESHAKIHLANYKELLKHILDTLN